MADEPDQRGDPADRTGRADHSPFLASLIDLIWPGRRQKNGEDDLREALADLMDEHQEAMAPIEPHERELIANVLQLRELTAEDVMVPRADIVAVDSGISLGDLVDALHRDAHSRLPVYKDTLDNVLGFVHIKDVLAHWGEAAVDISELIRPVPVIAPSMRALDLLHQMRRDRTQLALVVDEYGGIDGLITIEDLVEEIVGEIADEHDVVEEPRLTREADGCLVADARLAIEDFEQSVGPILSEEEREETDTLGGLVFYTAGRVPEPGETIEHDSGLVFEILDGDPRRIRRLRVRNLPAPAGAGPGEG